MMDTKLTLKLNSSIIEQAKEYAKHKNTSVSKLIESYLGLLVEDHSTDTEVTPLVKSLSGIVKLPKNYDYKKEHKQHVAKKYGK